MRKGELLCVQEKDRVVVADAFRSSEHLMMMPCQLTLSHISPPPPHTHTGKPLSKCGKCLRYLKYINARPQRLYCQTCEELYNVPQGGVSHLSALHCTAPYYPGVYWCLCSLSIPRATL